MTRPITLEELKEQAVVNYLARLKAIRDHRGDIEAGNAAMALIPIEGVGDLRFSTVFPQNRTAWKHHGARVTAYLNGKRINDEEAREYIARFHAAS